MIVRRHANGVRLGRLTIDHFALRVTGPVRPANQKGKLRA